MHKIREREEGENEVKRARNFCKIDNQTTHL